MRLFFRRAKETTELGKIYEKLATLEGRITRIEKKLGQVENSKTHWKNLRVGVFVDVQNMFYGAKKIYNARINYVKLLPYIVNNRRLIKAIAYIIDNPEIDQSGFVSLLSQHLFEIRRKPLIQRADGSQKGDFDMEMALDILSIINYLDVVSLVTGDGDFVPLVNVIKARGPKVEVYGFNETTAIVLKEAADEFLPIGEDLLLK